MKCNIVLFKNNKVKVITSEITESNYYVAKENQKLVCKNITKYLKKLAEEGIITSIRVPKPRNKELKEKIVSLFEARKTIQRTLRQLYDYFE